MEASGMQQSLVTFFVEAVDGAKVSAFITLTLHHLSADL